MKTLHVVALACFAVAVCSYLAAWTPGAVGLAMVGMLFEMMAWGAIYLESTSGPSTTAGTGTEVQTTDQPRTDQPRTDRHGEDQPHEPRGGT